MPVTKTISRISLPLWLLVALVAAGCSGLIDDPMEEGESKARNGGPGEDSQLGAPPLPGDGFEGPSCGVQTPETMRRLTGIQYHNTVVAVFGDVDPGELFPEVTHPGLSGFSNATLANGVTETGVSEISMATEHIVEQLRASAIIIVPCAFDGSDEVACITDWVQTQVPIAWRGPVTTEEVGFLVDEVYTATRSEGLPAEDAFAVLAGVVLQHPRFIYHAEVGNEALEDGRRPLTSWELAARLSYLYWDAPPDAELRALAVSGELFDVDVLEGQAERLLRDGRARPGLLRFFHEWLEIYRLDEGDKDPELFPDWDADFEAELTAEFDVFIDHVLWEDDGRLSTLLGSNTAFVTPRLSEYYGMTSAGTEDAWARVELEASERAGIFTRGLFLAAHAHDRRPSPVFRGAFMREKVFCQPLAEPPDLVDAGVEVEPDASTRERLAAHRDDPTCSSCHALMDPIGLSFEHYDAIGQWRDFEDNGRAVDASGALSATDVDAEFYGGVALTQQLIQSTDVAQCVTLQWYRFTRGRLEQSTDQCAVESLHDDFAAADYDLRDLMIGVVALDSFRFLPAAN